MNFSDLSSLGDFWHWITSWWDIMRSFGKAGIAVAACAGIAWVVPSIRIKIAAIVVGVVIILTTIAFGVGENKGAARVQANWDWSLGVEVKDGETAHDDAERTVAAEPPAGVLNDPWNRDNWSK